VLAGLAGSVALYVVAAMVDRKLEIALGRRLPREWHADSRLRESHDGWMSFSVLDLFRRPGWAARWLLGITAFSFVWIALGAHWWLIVALGVIYAAAWTRTERAEAKTWTRRLREEHPDWPAPENLRLLDGSRWAARFVMWLAFIAAPVFLGAAIAGLF
jgi:hypothetical protein